MSDAPGRLRSALAGRYAIERELGRGGMATVYLATDLKHRRPVALKVLDPELARSVGPERFLQEIRIAASLTHPNILPLHDSGEAEGILYYMMPYVAGESLRDCLTRQRHLGLEETVRIVGQVAAALGHAHRRGIIHRDIKPENILLADGQALVADFGIARAIDAAGTERLTATGLAVGTPAYMSPEQVGAERALDGRSDIYSLGCVAYEMLCGAPPFTGPSVQAVMARHAVDPVPPLRTLRPTIPLAVQRAIETALAKVTADRFATAEAFAEALSRASTAEATAAEVRPPSWPGRRWPRVALGAVFVVTAAWWLTNRLGTPAIQRFAVLPFTSPMNDSTLDYLVEGMHDGLIAELARTGLGVIARTSVMQYQGSQKPVREIARELGVDALVEASLTGTVDSVTIAARLVDGRTEQYRWSQSYATDRAGVATLPGAVAGALAQAIEPQRTAEATDRQPSRPVNVEAYDAHLKGRFHLNRPGRAELDAALQYFELALSKDSTFAPAWAGISNVWGVRRQRGYVTPGEAAAAANAAARRALVLDSTLPEPHFALATTKTWGEWDWPGAERAFREAIRLRPDYPQARAFYAHLLCILGRPREAMRQIARARELDPLDPLLQWLHGAALSLLRRYDDAVAQYQGALSRSPRHPSVLRLLSLTLHHQGRYEAALAAARTWAEGDPELAGALARGEVQGGYAGAMRAVAHALVARSRTTYVPPWDIALWYAAAGDTEGAIAMLQRAFEVRDPGMPYLGVHPSFDGLRHDARFQDLMRRMNLPSREAGT